MAACQVRDANALLSLSGRRLITSVAPSSLNQHQHSFGRY